MPAAPSILCWVAKAALLALQGAVQALITATAVTLLQIEDVETRTQSQQPAPRILAGRSSALRAGSGGGSNTHGAASGGLSAKCFLGHPTER